MALKNFRKESIDRKSSLTSVLNLHYEEWNKTILLHSSYSYRREITQTWHESLTLAFSKRLRLRERRGATLEITLNEIENGNWELARLKRETRMKEWKICSLITVQKVSNK